MKRKSYFPLQSLNAALPMNMPVADRPLASCGKYAGIVETLSANFKEMPPQEMKGNELLRILEDTLSYAPSSTAKGEVCDISLFDHVKITAAVASSLLRYMHQHGVADYKNFCYTRGLETARRIRCSLFLLTSPASRNSSTACRRRARCACCAGAPSI